MARRARTGSSQGRRKFSLDPRAIEAIDRRRFVRTAGGILVGAGLGCATEALTGEELGTIQVTLTGIPANVSGGTVVATPRGGGDVTTINAPAGLTNITTQVRVGTYDVVYTPPNGYQLANPIPASVTITAGQTTSVQVNLQQIPATQGSLQVTVTGLQAGAPNGGTAVATPSGGGSAMNINVAASGTGTASLAPGSYSVAYTPPANHNLAGGVTNPQTVAVTSGQTTNVQYGVVPVGGPTFQTPNLINNASFESNYSGFSSAGFTAPTNVSRDTARAFDGATAVKRSLPVTNGTPGGDLGGGMAFPFYAGSPLGSYTPSPAVPAQTHDRLWARFYFNFDTAVNGTFKFQIWESPSFSDQFGGIYLFNGNIAWWFVEYAFAQTSGHVVLASLSSLLNAWHWIEVEYWRNGHPSGFPAVSIWLDGNQITSSGHPAPSPSSWSGNYVVAGRRDYSSKLGTYNMLGVLNGAPANTIPGNVWIDRVALSSLGRIGP